MKLKSKMIASIMSICLVCAVFAIGVFALKTANLKIGGDVLFSATGVEADIKEATLKGAATNSEVILSSGNIDTSMTQGEIDKTFENWKSLKLDFNENADDIVLSFKIANTSANADNYIEIDYNYSFTTEDPNVDVFPGNENAEKVWENNNYILTPKGSATGATATYETFTLKFKVLDKELDVPAGTKVNLTLALKHTTPVSGTVNGTTITTTDGLSYTVSGTTASVTNSVYTYENDLTIPAVVTDGVSNYIVNSVGFSDATFKSVYMPNSVTGIWFTYNIGDCVSVSKGVTDMPNDGFSYNGIKSITLHNGIRTIGKSAFEACGFINFVIPNSVLSIGNNAFYATGLLTITIPNSVVSLGESAFSFTSLVEVINLSDINITPGSYGLEEDVNVGQTKTLTYVGDFVFYEFNGMKSLARYIGSEENITLPTTYESYSVRSGALGQYSSISSLTIPSNVIEIGEVMPTPGIVKIDSQQVLSSGNFLKLEMEDPYTSQQFYIKNGLTVPAYLLSTTYWTPEKVGDAVGDADGDGYTLYTKVVEEF